MERQGARREMTGEEGLKGAERCEKRSNMKRVWSYEKEREREWEVSRRARLSACLLFICLIFAFHSIRFVRLILLQPVAVRGR